MARYIATARAFDDHHAIAQAGTKADGSIDWREQYTPFGEQIQNPAANDNLDGFTGHIKDKATGLNYMQARYYDPVIGRFLSVDPVGFLETGNPGYFNRYAYTFNDPVNLTDPTGMCPAALCPRFQPLNQGYVQGPSPSDVRTARAERAISFVRRATGASSNISITYRDTYASLSNTLGVIHTNTKDETFNGTVTPIDGVTENGTAVTIFRSAVEPTGETRAYRDVDADGNVGIVNTSDQLTGTENAVRVTGHEVAGHAQGGSVLVKLTRVKLIRLGNNC